jgi:hypothetical protein
MQEESQFAGEDGQSVKIVASLFCIPVEIGE